MPGLRDTGILQWLHQLIVGNAATPANDGDVSASGGLNLGTATGAAAGQAKTSGNVTTTAGVDVGTATGAIAGQITTLGAASGTDVIKANSNTAAAADAAYISMNARARFGFDGAGNVIINDAGTTKTILLQTGAPTTRISISGTGVVTVNGSVLWGLGTALPATTGTMTATMDSTYKSITPSGACTFNATGGVAGQTCSFVITTSGVSSFVLTWGTAFKTVGTLATGTTSGKVFTVSFIYDGSNWSECSRSTAM